MYIAYTCYRHIYICVYIYIYIYIERERDVVTVCLFFHETPRTEGLRAEDAALREDDAGEAVHVLRCSFLSFLCVLYFSLFVVCCLLWLYYGCCCCFLRRSCFPGHTLSDSADAPSWAWAWAWMSQPSLAVQVRIQHVEVTIRRALGVDAHEHALEETRDARAASAQFVLLYIIKYMIIRSSCVYHY